ncbi:MAG: hypothetical protein RL357_1051 [Pseudomonadota bacterium]|jgi:hypothetical protein
MNYVIATIAMVLPPLLVGTLVLIGVRTMNGGANSPDDWVAVFLAMSVGALTWLACWTWVRIQLRKEEIK